MDASVERWNRVPFDGELSPEGLELLKGLDGEHPDVRTVVERMMPAMSQTRFGARDFSTYLAWELGRVLPRTHPRAWGGMVPPITGKGRHERLDEYVASSPWHPLGAGETFLDVGCGFPPATTVDAAERFPECRVIGIDPSFGRFLLRDEKGDYAVFDDRETLRYRAATPGAAERLGAGSTDMNAIWDPAAFAQGFWQGVFERLALAIIAAFGTLIFQRRQARYALREKLIDSINQFAISLNKPRKPYQAIIDQSCRRGPYRRRARRDPVPATHPWERHGGEGSERVLRRTGESRRPP